MQSARPASRRLQLWLAYDGTPFDGWQSQRSGNAIQDRLESALAAVCGCRVRVHGAGRTDAGVHALRQCAHADVPPLRMAGPAWRAALNARLPPEIRVVSARWAKPGFHSRFSAVGKTYRYRIWNAPFLPPLEFRRAWHVPHPVPLDTTAIRAALVHLTGTRDFAAFAANRGKPGEDTTRTIRSATLGGTGPELRLVCRGDGFLYKMVRLLTGTLVRVGQGKMSPDEFRQLLDRPHARKTQYCAPADGLCLVRVEYQPVRPMSRTGTPTVGRSSR